MVADERPSGWASGGGCTNRKGDTLVGGIHGPIALVIVKLNYIITSAVCQSGLHAEAANYNYCKRIAIKLQL